MQKQITKIDDLDFAKTILMAFVIIGHCCAFWTGEWFSVIKPAFNSPMLSILAKWLNTFHIYGFVLISGFIYAKIIKNGGYSSLKDFLWKKVKRLLIPYFFVSIIWVIPLSNYFFNFTGEQILQNYVLMKAPEHLWFLPMLFGVFVFFHLFRLSLRFETLTITCIILYVISFFIPPEYNYFQIIKVCQFIPFFLIGYIFGFKKENVWREDLNKKRGLSNPFILLILIIINLLLSAVLSMPEPFRGFRIVLGAIVNYEGAISIVSILVYLGHHLILNNKVYHCFSNNNFTIYLFHQPIIYYTLYYFNGCINPCLNAIINLIIAVIGSLLISLILRKFRYTRVLLGGA